MKNTAYEEHTPDAYIGDDGEVVLAKWIRKFDATGKKISSEHVTFTDEGPIVRTYG